MRAYFAVVRVAKIALQLIAHIHKLQGDLVILFFDEGDDGLQVIDLLAADAQLIILDRGLHFELRSFDQLDNFLSKLFFDPLLDRDFAPDRSACGIVRIAVLERFGVDLLAHDVCDEDLAHRIHLHLVCGEEADFLLIAVELDLVSGAAKVVSRRDLSIGVVDGVVDVLHLNSIDDIK